MYTICYLNFLLGGVHKLRLQNLSFFDHLPPSVYILKAVFLFDPAIQTACQKEAYAESFIKNGPPQAKWIHHLATWNQGCHDIS